mmetsp:Transcript_1671/g.4702  ORF Transcript_1671/g.4702 Transcript_1671/m.4702 type:complete len:83 (-) Transcript_1671:67-315(-)
MHRREGQTAPAPLLGRALDQPESADPDDVAYVYVRDDGRRRRGGRCAPPGGQGQPASRMCDAVAAHRCSSRDATSYSWLVAN